MSELLTTAREHMDPKYMGSAVIGAVFLGAAALSPIGQWVTGYGDMKGKVEQHHASIIELRAEAEARRETVAVLETRLETVQREQNRRAPVVDLYLETRAEVAQIKQQLAGLNPLTTATATLVEKISTLNEQLADIRARLSALELALRHTATGIKPGPTGLFRDIPPPSREQRAEAGRIR